MDSTTVDDLERRLKRVEREVRWWRTCGMASMVLLGAILLTGAMPDDVAKEIRARRFVVVNAEGKEVAYLDVGLGGLSLFDGRGRMRANLSVRSEGSAGLTFYNENMITRAFLSTDPDGTPHLRLISSSGRDWVAP